MYSESTLGAFATSSTMRSALDYPQKIESLYSCFLCQVLIQWFDRFRHHTYHCKFACNSFGLNGCLVFNTAQTIRASLFAKATQTTLKGLFALSSISHLPNTFPVCSGLDKTALAQ